MTSQTYSPAPREVSPGDWLLLIVVSAYLFLALIAFVLTPKTEYPMKVIGLQILALTFILVFCFWLHVFALIIFMGMYATGWICLQGMNAISAHD